MSVNPMPDAARLPLDRQSLHALGVLVPIRFNPVKVLPGRHPLGRAGAGMRMLRLRPYVPGEDNPRDIDRFSPPGDRQVIEWEDEAQASITLLVDVSASMAGPLKAPVRNACVLQLVYSLWRAGDRVGTVLFDAAIRDEIRAANLRAQITRTAAALGRSAPGAGTRVADALNAFVRRDQRRHSNLLFVISDFLNDAPSEPGVEWRDSIKELERNIVPVIVSYEIPLDVEGLVRLHDVERRRKRLAFFDRQRVARINDAERARVRELARRFRVAGLDSLVITKQDDTYPQLVELARVRRQRRT